MTTELKVHVDILVHYFTEFSKSPVRHMCFIKQARVQEIREQKATVHWALSPLLGNAAEVDLALMECFTAAGGDVRTGTVAANPMERRLQQDIDNLNDRLGKGGGKGK